MIKQSMKYFLSLIIFFGYLVAGSTGKIGGRIVDEKTGDPLVGVNIIVAGTMLGAASSIDGSFMIINIPPGRYSVSASMIGYKKYTITDVNVSVDRTTRLEFDLSETIIEGEEITVVAKRKTVELDRTNSASYINRSEIELLPVTSLEDIIQLQAGVVSDAGGDLHIRGGRSREIAYMIDGIPVTDNYSQSGGSMVEIENNFIEELQVITGTFNAEYGSAQSGVVNVVTKMPGTKYEGSIEQLMGGFYSPNKPQYIALDTFQPTSEKEIKISFSGPLLNLKKLGKIGFFLNGRLIDSNGWLNGERRYMPEDGWEIAVYREWYSATFDPKDPLIIPIPDSLHTGDGKIIPMDWEKTVNMNLKLVYKPLPSLTFSLNSFFNDSYGKGFSSSWRFCPDGNSTWADQSMSYMLVMTHSPSVNLFYNLRYSFQKSNSQRYTFKDSNDPRYQITAVNAWDPGKLTGYDFGGISSWNRNYDEQLIHLTNGDITWQINNNIQIKSGFETKSYSFQYLNSPMREKLGYETMQFPWSRSEIFDFEIPYKVFLDSTANYEFGNLRLRETHPDSAFDHLFYIDYTRKPMEASGFSQTSLELGKVILNAGVRLDYFKPNDRWAPDYSIVYPEFVGADGYYVQAKSKYKFSPRFGLSFPISTKGALRLSYGHFFQIPSYEKMYQNPVLSHYNQFSIIGSRIGNPNLKPENTVQYEVGYQQELTSNLVMELAVFHKDIKDLLGIEILTLSNAATFYRYVNKEYGNSSGATLSFNYSSPDGKFDTGVDYTYMLAKGSASSPEMLRNISVLSGPGMGSYTIAVRKIKYLDWDQRHSLNATMSYSPNKKWNINLVSQLGSGLPYSPSTLDPSISLPGGEWDNAGRKPVRWGVDFKLVRSSVLFGYNSRFIINVFNIFNQLNENHVRSITGRAGPNAYLPEINRLRNNRILRIDEFSLDEANYNPSNYSRPRLIQFGIMVHF
jgi:outer membrane receptor protein involved in Fe transport